ncbi:MAG TPA: DUF5666 domain-containing protein [Clostridia bacterium]|nr:DUF5666 domain-containing protein [Clostridia bacterium]
MEHDDRKYTDMLNEGLKDVEPDAELHGKVREAITRNVARVRRRNTAFGAVAIAIVLTVALSTVTPVFGRNGTLPQVVAAMAAQRQAQKMTETLGTATVQQTSAALLVPEATVQTVADSTLSETDSILALVIADRVGKPVGEVVALRSQGLGWGVIMAQLGISGHDISEAVGRAQATAVASSSNTASQGQGTTSQPGVSNSNGDKIVVNGEITGVSTTLITVSARTFVIAPETQLKYHGKAITPAEIVAKLSAGKLYATVQGTRMADTSLRAALIIVQDGADTQDTPSAENNDDQANQAVSNEQQARGKVTAVSATMLRIDGFAHDIVLNTATKVEQVGAGKADVTSIKVGQTLQVHVVLSGTTYTAQQVHIEDKYVKADTSSDVEGSQPATPSNERAAVSNEQQARGKVTAVSATMLRIDGFAHDIVLNASTKVEQVGAGKADVTFIKVGQTLQVHVVLSGTTYTAQQVHIEDKYVKAGTNDEQTTDPALKTWQGTIASIVPGGQFITLAEVNPPYVFRIIVASVLQDSKNKSIAFASLAVGQKVTITGRLLADGSAEIVKLVVTTDAGANPGKGNGKH